MSQELNFTDREKLKNWLEGKPAAWAQVIAWRAALRAAPALGRLANSKLSDENRQRLVLSVYRVLLILSAARKWPADDMKIAAAARAADAADAAAAYAAAAAARAATNVAAAAGYAYAYAVDAYAHAADAAAAAATATDAVWQAVTGDAAFLNQSGAPEELAKRPLWPDDQPPANLQELWVRHKQAAPDFAPWQAWHEAATGRNSQEAPHDRFGDDLTRRIALQTNEWWERDPAAVNADVARWLKVTPDNIRPRHISDGVDGEDLLGVRRQAQLLARLLADRETDLPLAIGLFGPWGGGKSFFMKEIKEGIQVLEKKRGAHCHHAVAHIAFNAWHYVDADLWASLGLRIFEGITEHLGGQRQNKLAMERHAVTLQAQTARQGKAAAESMIIVAEENRNKIISEINNKNLQKLPKQISKNIKDIISASSLNWGDDFKKIAAIAKLAEPKDLQSVEATFSEVQKLAETSRSWLPSGLRRWLMEETWFGRILFLAALLSLAARGSLLLPSVQTILNEWATTYLVAVLSPLIAAITGGLAWLAPGLKKLREAADLAAKYQARFDAARKAAKANSPGNALAGAEQELDKLYAALCAADAEITAAEMRLLEIDSGVLIHNHLTERTQDAQYTGRQGVVALLRRDLEDLTRQIQQLNPETAKISRIILYIDDLDRCEPKRVVEVLQAVHLLLAFPLFAVVVAVDPRWLERALYEKYAPGERRKPGETPTGDFCPRNYLEKIFQIPYRLKPMGQGFSGLVDGLTKNMIEAPPQKSADADSATATETGAQPSRNDSPKEDSRPHGNDDEEKTKEKNDEMKMGKADAGDVTEDKGQAPLPPLPRLTLSPDEVTAIRNLQPFIPTPRGAKRLLNVYLLARMQQPEAAEAPGVAMTLLALEIGFPVAGRDLLQKIRAAEPDSAATLFSLAENLQKSKEAKQLADALQQTAPDITVAAAFPWLDAAAQFSFDAPQEDDAPEAAA